VKDELVRAVGFGDQVRLVAVHSTHLTERARNLHRTYPVATAALGRALAAALSLAALTLKGQERLTLRILGNGPLRGLVADADARGSVRGYVKEPSVLLPLRQDGKLDVGRAVGEGEIVVSRDASSGEVYTSSTKLVSGEIAEDVAHYLDTSEQIPSACAFGVRLSPKGRVLGAGGIVVQLLPGAETSVIRQLEGALTSMAPVSLLVAHGASAEDLLTQLAPAGAMSETDTRPVRFRCTCSRAKSERAIRSLGRLDLTQMIREGWAEVTCHFCRRVYAFNEEELKGILASLPPG